MSDAFGIAGVTAVLRRRLLDAFAAADLAGAIGLAPVTTMPPDRVIEEDEPTGVNLYLHQVTPNVGWRNLGQPTFSASGARLSNPPLALDLHYLLTAYGAEPYHAEVLLGHAMLALHGLAVLGPAEISAALAGGAPPPDPDLPDPVRTSGLAEQVESLRVTHEPMDPEAASRLWSAMQAKYRMTAAYLVTVVLLEPSVAASVAKPVREVRSVAIPLERPTVDRVEDAADPTAPILDTSTLAIVGARLGPEPQVVRVDDQEVLPAPPDVSSVRITLPPAALPTPLRAGVHAVQVVRSVDLGDPAVAHQVLESEAAPFLLRPRITALARANTGVAPVDGVPRADGTLTLTLAPPVTAAQRVRVQLDHLASGESVGLAVERGNGVVPPAVEAAQVSAAYLGLRTGAHLVRVLVDGAGSPVSGVPFDQPQVVV